MADSQAPQSTHIAQQEATTTHSASSIPLAGSQPQSSLGASEGARAVEADAARPAVVDQVEEAIVEGAAAANNNGGRPHEMPTAGNVQVGETGDLNELAAARRQSKGSGSS